MIRSIKYKNICWIDIQEPSSEDINYLKTNFKFHPIVLSELIRPAFFPKIKNYRNYLFLILEYPIYDKIKRETKSQELDILITRNTLITVHTQAIFPLQIIWDKLSKTKDKEKKDFKQGTGQLLYTILNRLFGSSILKLNRIKTRIDSIEEEIFKEKEMEMVKEISIVKRDIVDFYRIIEPQKPVVDSLVKEGEDFFGKEISPFFSDLSSSFNIIWNQVKNSDKTIHTLEETNNSLLTTKTNETIKVLTIFSVVLLPLTLIASIWGMNTAYLPFKSSSTDFWFILGIMLILAVVMISFIRLKRWW